MNKQEVIIHRLAALVHDMGKPATLTFDEVTGQPHAYGHENELAAIISFMNKIGVPNHIEKVPIRKPVLGLVSLHMHKHLTEPEGQTKRGAAKLLLALKESGATYEQWKRLMVADDQGRIPAGMPDFERLDAFVEEMRVDAALPDKLLTGKHLISLGLKPSKLFGQLIAECFELQLADIIKTEKNAIEWVVEQLG